MSKRTIKSQIINILKQAKIGTSVFGLYLIVDTA